MTHTFLAMMAHYGYPAVFLSLLLGIIGLPVPDEVLLLFAGSLAGTGTLHFLPLLLTAWIGSSLGMTVNFLIGRRIGIARLSRVTRWVRLTEDKLNKGAETFRRVGPILIPIGFFVAGLRHISPFVAGASRMTWKQYGVYAYTGSLVWISCFLFIGKQLGPHWHAALHALHHPGFILLVIGTAAFLVLVFRRYVRVPKLR